jgi:uncharacterized protein with PIN domain
VTPYKLTSISFSEIPNLEVTCNECKGKIVLPLPSPKSTLPQFLDCPSCGKRLWEGGEDGVYASVSGFARALSSLKQNPHKTITLGFTLIDSGD